MNIDSNSIEKLLEAGRREYDRMQKNLSEVLSSTDEELLRHPDPESRRQLARDTQDKLDKEGRENYAMRYASTNVRNR
jgi:hypothetical protein